MSFSRVLYATTLISLVLVFQVEAVTFSAAMSQKNGGISLSVDDSTWFSSAPTEVFVEGRWWSAQSGSLKMVSKLFDVPGHDNLGGESQRKQACLRQNLIARGDNLLTSNMYAAFNSL